MGLKERRRVVVTGMGAISPLGVGVKPLYERWVDGVCAIENNLGACKEFIPSEHLSKKEIRRMDRFAQLSVVAAGEALEQAGWAEQIPYGSFDVGLIMSTGIGGLSTVERNHLEMTMNGVSRMSPLGIPMFMPNAGAASISMKYGIQGSSFGVVSACASSAHAVGLGARLIGWGDFDAVVVGGAEATLTDFGYASFNTMQALSKSGYSRPFDARRDGFVMGEGAAVLVLENAESAIARGATIYGEVSGFGSTSDAGDLVAPDPSGTPASAAITRAVKDAGLTPEQISYVNAHGTSTPLNDSTETKALKLALGDTAYKIPTSSVKSATGHLLGASGAVEAVVTIEALNARVAPPTLGYGEPDPACDLDYVPNKARPMEVVGEGAPYAISNSFAFGGHNVSLVLRGGH